VGIMSVESDVMVFEDMPLTKTKKIKGKAMKKEVSTNITELSSGRIVWFLVKKHKFMLAILFNVLQFGLLLQDRLPIAYHNLIR
jgi:hypothetical protein